MYYISDRRFIPEVEIETTKNSTYIRDVFTLR